MNESVDGGVAHSASLRAGPSLRIQGFWLVSGGYLALMAAKKSVDSSYYRLYN